MSRARFYHNRLVGGRSKVLVSRILWTAAIVGSLPIWRVGNRHGAPLWIGFAPDVMDQEHISVDDALRSAQNYIWKNSVKNGVGYTL